MCLLELASVRENKKISRASQALHREFAEIRGLLRRFNPVRSGTQIKKPKSFLILALGAEGGTRTPTGLRPLRPERSASTNSTTSACYKCGEKYKTRLRKSSSLSGFCCKIKCDAKIFHHTASKILVFFIPTVHSTKSKSLHAKAQSRKEKLRGIFACLRALSRLF